jgi:hypothetical protein
MCAEGELDAHQFSDATLIYGEHWGEDTIALSQLTDGAIIIAPFGGWTYVECLALLAKRKIVAIYNDFFNILNYSPLNIPDNIITKDTIANKKEAILPENSKSDDEIRTMLKMDYALTNIPEDEFKQEKELTPYFTDSEIRNILAKKKVDNDNNAFFFKFLPTEQNSIIDYYINYYIVLLYILCKNTFDTLSGTNKFSDDKPEDIKPEDIKPDKREYNDLCECLKFGIQILTHLKIMIANPNFTIDENFTLVISACNDLKNTINATVNKYLDNINKLYTEHCISIETNTNKEYQLKQYQYQYQ